LREAAQLDTEVEAGTAAGAAADNDSDDDDDDDDDDAEVLDAGAGRAMLCAKNEGLALGAPCGKKAGAGATHVSALPVPAPAPAPRAEEEEEEEGSESSSSLGLAAPPHEATDGRSCCFSRGVDMSRIASRRRAFICLLLLPPAAPSLLRICLRRCISPRSKPASPRRIASLLRRAAPSLNPTLPAAPPEGARTREEEGREVPRDQRGRTRGGSGGCCSC